MHLAVIPRNLLIAVGGASALVAALLALFVSPAAAAVVALLSGLAVLGGVVPAVRDRSNSEALVQRIAREAESGRRLAIYERETGFFAHWYIAMRGQEECARARRYEHTLTLAVVEPKQQGNDRLVESRIAGWLQNGLRETDIVGYLGNGRYVIVMPETDDNGSRGALARLAADVGDIDVGVSVYPTDGAEYDALLAAATRRLGQPLDLPKAKAKRGRARDRKTTAA